MKSYVRNTLLAAAGLVVLSLPAQAASSTTMTDSLSTSKSTAPVQLAQRPYDPSAGSVGFKKSKKKKKKSK